MTKNIVLTTKLLGQIKPKSKLNFKSLNSLPFVEIGESPTKIF